LSPDDADVTDKKLYLAVVGADNITIEVADTISATTYNPEKSDTVAPFSTDGVAATAFILGAGIDSQTTADDTGVASFTFYGVLNSYADWVASDVKVTAAYTLAALRPGTYTALFAETVGVNQVAAAVTGYTTSGNLTYVKASQASGWNIPFTLAGASTSGLVVKINTSTLVLNTDYTISGNVIAFTPARIALMNSGISRTLTITVGGQDYARNLIVT